MRKPDLVSGPNDNQTSGWTHVALVLGATEAVDRKAASLQKEGWLKEQRDGPAVAIMRQWLLIRTATGSRSWWTSEDFLRKLRQLTSVFQAVRGSGFTDRVRFPYHLVSHAD